MAGRLHSVKDRADKLLVSLGLFESRASARAAIEAGQVFASGMLVTKPSQILSSTVTIKAAPAHPYVSRGGIKLAHALDQFGVDPDGRICLDIGASTGGFSDVLLRRGARHIVAVDVGRSQFHPLLRADPRITNLEAQDARTLTPEMLGETPSLLVCDASFISMQKLLGRPLSLAAAQAEFVGLFKPQFEVGRDHIGKGGIVTDISVADRAAEAFELWLGEQGWPVRAWTPSPISGGDGNAERLFHAVRDQ